MHKPDQNELQFDWSQLPYSEHLGPVQQEVAQPNITKMPTIDLKKGENDICILFYEI